MKVGELRRFAGIEPRHARGLRDGAAAVREKAQRVGPRRVETRWERRADVKANLRNVSVLANNRVVSNIKGNDYRVVVAMRYDKQIMFIRFIGTHAEYDRIDATTV